MGTDNKHWGDQYTTTDKIGKQNQPNSSKIENVWVGQKCTTIPKIHRQPRVDEKMQCPRHTQDNSPKELTIDKPTNQNKKIVMSPMELELSPTHYSMQDNDNIPLALDRTADNTRAKHCT